MIDYRYDTQLLIEGTGLDEDAINDYFRTNFQGDCLLAVGDDAAHADHGLAQLRIEGAGVEGAVLHREEHFSGAAELGVGAGVAELLHIPARLHDHQVNIQGQRRGGIS